MPPDKSPSRFEDTRWSVVMRTRETGPQAERALDEVCRSYWRPLYAYARRWGRSGPDAEDAVQAFFAAALRRELFAKADPGQGRLRSLLLTAFKRHLHDLAAGAAAGKRRPGEGGLAGLDEVEERLLQPEAESGSHEELFDREWARTVLREALAALEERYRREGKEELFQALRPYLSQSEDAAAREALADRLSMTGTAVGVALHRLRKRYREAMRAAVAATVADEAEVEAEFRALAAILGKSGT